MQTIGHRKESLRFSFFSFPHNSLIRYQLQSGNFIRVLVIPEWNSQAAAHPGYFSNITVSIRTLYYNNCPALKDGLRHFILRDLWDPLQPLYAQDVVQHVTRIQSRETQTGKLQAAPSNISTLPPNDGGVRQSRLTSIKYLLQRHRDFTTPSPDIPIHSSLRGESDRIHK